MSGRWSPQLVQRALELAVTPAGPGFSAISTDTRSLEPGSLFVALAGERFDGHDHLGDALARGASAAIVRRGTAPVPGLELIEVDDTLRAYGRLARERRREIRGPVIAVTGTNGKTSTKEMLRAVLGTKFRVHATRANLNNLVGVPLTILESPPDTDALVVEAGANLPGEIARYREIIEPTIAVVTNVGSGHLEGFGSIAGVMREKLALVADVPLAIVGIDPPELAEQARPLARRVLTAGLTAAERKARDVELDEEGRATFTAAGHRVTLPFPGRHLAANAMLAWTVAEELGLDLPACAGALSAFSLPGGRSEVVNAGGLTILNDCYNANPQSFLSAIATARAMRHGRRLVFVAGTMRELGPESDRLHAEVAEQLVLLKPDLLAAVGDFVAPLQARAAELGERLVTAPDPLTLGPRLAERLQGDEIVVLKASRGVALERILPYLTTGRTPPTEA
ncbi:MAG TPA: UDP-N-acetylmuramoyl-tripeptide--D-alanyl-D-alanine ligase [Gemmatimonadales bacterium]|nr:UDP-N-acetylmuramoyl-tripeptide--D-alanyl-D-alanine ligase [Gemmatimonadales bacterium]